MMRVYQALNRYMSSTETWFRRGYAAKLPNLRIAYFSAEFGLTESLPIYSGGLGVLSGDHLKSASDLGLPLVGVGLLYQEGYMRQYLNADGWQQERYPVNDFHNLPLQLERGRDGNPVKVQVELPGRNVVAQVWRVQVGRVPLFLLDTNVDENPPADRDITDRLYGGDADMRIRQEIVLGIGGMRALEALGIQPSVFHMNEGHSAFLALERIRMAMSEHSIPFSVARELTSAGNVFTTHTSVPAGIDRFPLYLMDHYFTAYFQSLGLSRDDFLRLGRGNDGEDSFCMAILALHLAAKANGVSKLHGQVSRGMWQYLWPQTPVEEVPITSVSNGIHPPSWLSQDVGSLLLRYLGPRWADRPYEHTAWERVRRIPDEELWRTHERRRERLVAMARERLRQQSERRGGTPKELESAVEALNPEVLTIGFARRVATYKRLLFLTADPERLSRILNHPTHPVQILFAGKAHPRDNPGKELIRQLVHFARREDMRRRIVFLEDYDISLARYLVQGVDVWLNNPRSLEEASGTSGMKAAMNGALNLSGYDGWWAEGYDAEVGWRIGMGEVYQDQAYGDSVEVRVLYDLLEKDVIPLFYERGADGLPRGWIKKMKNSMARIAPQFNTYRMLQEYAERFYFPCAERHERMRSEEVRVARELSEWLDKVRSHWAEVRINEVSADVEGEWPVNTDITVAARITLGALSPQDVAVQVYYGQINAQGQIAGHRVSTLAPSQDAQGNPVFVGTLSCSSSGLHGFTVRVLPCHPDLLEPQGLGLVVWSS
jgi:starch phosphorylase